jgi:hypothetical protein
VAQKLPADLIPKVLSYIVYVDQLRQNHGYQLEDIGAMDETPIWIDMVAETTVDHVGKSPSLLKPLDMIKRE